MSYDNKPTTSNPDIDPFTKIEKARNLEAGDQLTGEKARITTVTPMMNEFGNPVLVTVQLENGKVLTYTGDDRITVAITHGTPAAIARHRRYKVPMCEPCRELDRQLVRERVARHRAQPGNQFIHSDELFALRNEPRHGVAVIVPVGLTDPVAASRRYFVLRAPDRTPRLLPIGPAGVISMDGRAYPALREIRVEDGQKIAFSRNGDVWRIRYDASGEPTFEPC